MKIRYSIPNLGLIPESGLDLKGNSNNMSDAFSFYFFQHEEVIKNSRFICSLAHCDSIITARLAISHIQQKYSDATHNCWAFQVDEPKSSKNVGYSDDGEPHGTAGKPMLSQLLHSDIGEVVAVVTRYFGGTKLGTGGLVRAYQFSVSQALDRVPLSQKVEQKQIKVILDYSHAGFLHRMLNDYEITIAKEEFGSDITFYLNLPADRFAEFIPALQEVTDGTFILEE